MVPRRELCSLLFGASPDKEQAVTIFIADLMEWLHNIHQFLKVASCRCIANSAGFQERDQVSCCLTWIRRWWWSTQTDWPHIEGLLGIYSLEKEAWLYEWETGDALCAPQLKKHHKLPLPLSGWFWKLRLLRFTKMQWECWRMISPEQKCMELVIQVEWPWTLEQHPAFMCDATMCTITPSYWMEEKNSAVAFSKIIVNWNKPDIKIVSEKLKITVPK